MAIEDTKNQIVKAFKCAAALATNNVVVMIDTSAADTVKVPTANTDVPIGVTLNTTATAGDFVDVCLFGIAKVKTAAGITRAAHVQINDTSGYIKTLVSTGYDLGTALETATSGDIIPVFVNIIGIPKV